MRNGGRPDGLQGVDFGGHEFDAASANDNAHLLALLCRKKTRCQDDASLVVFSNGFKPPP
jgi:hypothetical protein